MRLLKPALLLAALTLTTPFAYAQEPTQGSTQGSTQDSIQNPAIPAQTPRPALLVHGHYCGPGNDGMNVAPIDALDAACRKHDACTPDGGLPSCGCNRALKLDAARLAASPRVPEDERMMAGLVAQATDLIPCSEGLAGLKP